MTIASTGGFLRQYLHPRSDGVEAVDVTYHRDGLPLLATLYRPVPARRAMPAWVVLHGLTWSGRRHPSLDRFTRSLAAGGALVLVPEVPEWQRLEVAPALTAATIDGAIEALRQVPGAGLDIGVIGFSFGATQALTALADPRLEGRVRSLAAWGGYCDLHNLFRFGLTGQHELDGRILQIQPDPYGAWIMGGNYLTAVPGHEKDTDVAGALLELARESGRRGTYAWEPVYDEVKLRLRQNLPLAKWEVFDLFAPLSGQPLPDSDFARHMTRALADAALSVDPLLDPRPFLPGFRVRTLVAHGRDDRLVPYTESIRISRALPDSICHGATVTSLFAHSGGAIHGLGAIGRAREGFRFVRLLHEILALV